MSRTSKTKIGGGSGEQSDRMMRASASGSEAVQRAHSELLAQQRANNQSNLQNAQLASQVVGQGEERKNQKEQFAQQTAQRKAEFDVSSKQQQERTDLDAAKAGFERGGGPGGDRAAKLQAEMDRGQGQKDLIGPLQSADQERLREQGQKPMEMGGDGTWRPTAERQQGAANEQKAEAFKAETERMRVMAYRDQVGQAAQRARASGDQEVYDEKVKILMNVPNGEQSRFDRLMKGDVNSNDWSDLAAMAKGNTVDPTIEADIKAKQFTPRVAAFARSQVARHALESIMLSDGSVDGMKVDWTNPKMQEFVNQRTLMSSFAASNPAFSEMLKVKDTQDKMHKLNSMAALHVWMGLSQKPRGKASGGMTPAMGQSGMGDQGMQEPPPPQHSQMPQSGASAVTAVRNAGGSPQQALQAGQGINPTGQEPGGSRAPMRGH